MANVWPTGCTGFSGSQLAQRLENAHSLYGLVRHITRIDFLALGKTVENIRFIKDDIAELHSLQSSSSLLETRESA